MAGEKKIMTDTSWTLRINGKTGWIESANHCAPTARKELETMSKRFIPNTRQKDGSGVPTPPKLFANSLSAAISGHDSGAVEIVRSHLVKTYGKADTEQHLRSMSAMDVLSLADQHNSGGHLT